MSSKVSGCPPYLEPDPFLCRNNNPRFVPDLSIFSDALQRINNELTGQDIANTLSENYSPNPSEIKDEEEVLSSGFSGDFQSTAAVTQVEKILSKNDLDSYLRSLQNGNSVPTSVLLSTLINHVRERNVIDEKIAQIANLFPSKLGYYQLRFRLNYGEKNLFNIDAAEFFYLLMCLEKDTKRAEVYSSACLDIARPALNWATEAAVKAYFHSLFAKIYTRQNKLSNALKRIEKSIALDPCLEYRVLKEHVQTLVAERKKTNRKRKHLFESLL